MFNEIYDTYDQQIEKALSPKEISITINKFQKELYGLLRDE